MENVFLKEIPKVDNLIKALSVLAIIVFLGSCDAGSVNPSQVLGQLSVSIDSQEAGRLLNPTTPLTITNFILNITGPSNPAPIETTQGGLLPTISLIPGNYTLTVDGYNSENVALGRGIATFTIQPGLTSSVSPVLTALPANGTFTLEAITTGLNLTNPAITATLTKGATVTPLTLTQTNGTWTLTTPMAPGTYTLITTLKDGITHLTSGIETVFIVAGATTYGGLSFVKGTPILSSITLNAPQVTGGDIVNPTAASPTITISPEGVHNINTDITITMTGEAGSEIRYTLDGSNPTASSSLYSTPLVKTHTAPGAFVVKAFASVTGKNNSPITTASYVVKDPSRVSTYYKTNPNGQVGKYKTGMSVTCVSTKSDSFADWSADMIIAQGAAYDDAKSFNGNHEYPSYDSYALYATWDDTNLYLGWQFVYVNDIMGNSGGNEAKPTNGDIPQMLVFDVDSTKASIGTLATGKNLWYNTNPTGFNFNQSLGVDKIAMFSSKGGVGQPSLFSMGADGFFDYTVANTKGFAAAGIVYGAVDGLLPAEVWGVQKSGYTPADLEGTTGWVDFVAKGHAKTLDTFYEMKIPFSALGITRSDLETKGIGVMHVSIYGTSGVNSLPFDKTTLDNVMLPYSQDASSSNEKEDLDIFTEPLARIGKL